MKKTLNVIAVLLFAVAEACSSQPSNLLLGTWKLDRSGAGPGEFCREPMVFTLKTITQRDSEGTESTTAVTYVTGDTKSFPTVVYVLTDAGMYYHTTYRFLSKDKMILDTASQCAYVRQ